MSDLPFDVSLAAKADPQPAWPLRLLFTVIVCALALGLTLLGLPLLQNTVFLMFVPAIVFCTWMWGLESGALAVVLAMLGIELLVEQPLMQITLGLNDLVRLGVFSLVVFLTSQPRQRIALRHSEMRLQTALQNMPVLLSVYDESGRRIAWNKEAERITGYTAAEVLGSPTIFERMYPDPVQRAEIRQFRRQHTGEYRDWVLKTTCKDGSVRYISWSSVARSVHIPGWHDWAIGMDITERVLAQQRAESLQAVTASLVEAVTSQDVAEIVVSQGLNLLGAHLGSVALLTDDGMMLRLVNQRGIPQPLQQQYGLLPLDARTPLTDAIRQRKTIWIETADQYRARYPHIFAQAHAQTGTQALAAVPLMLGERVIGGLGISLPRPHTFTDDEKAFIETLAQVCAQAIDRARLYEREHLARVDVEEYAERLARLQMVTEKLATALTRREVAQVMAEFGFASLDMDAGLLFLLTPEGDSLELHHHYGYLAEAMNHFEHIPLSAPTPITDAVRTRTPLFFGTGAEYAAAYPHLGQAAAATRTEGLLALPLIVNDQVIGGFGLTAYTPRQFTSDHIGFAMTLAQQCAQALDRARLYEEAEQRAAHQERQRLARDLHDAVSQTLFSASVLAETIPRVWETRPEKAGGLLNDLLLLNRGALAEMRSLLVELRPDMLVSTRLDRLIGQLVDAARGRQRLDATLRLRLEQPELLPPDVQVAFYRIAQEALNNVIKHADAKRAVVGLSLAPARVTLRVLDNGHGFDTHSAVAGLGLKSMRERAESVGARLRVYSRTDRGTLVTAVWSPK